MAIEDKKYTENKKRKKYVLTFEDLQYIIPAFRSKSGALLLKILYSLAGINKINDFKYFFIFYFPSLPYI